MGEWTTVYEDEIEGRLVTLKVYRSDQAADEDGDDDPAIRVTTTSAEGSASVVEDDQDGIRFWSSARRQRALSHWSPTASKISRES